MEKDKNAAMENRFAERIAAIRALMRENGWDILILTGSDPHARA